ncbi:SRPBCC family protein [Agromyces sp. NPDC055520]
MTTTDPNPTRFGTIERTADGGIIRYDRRLAFPVDEVWSAITEPERLAEWWPPFATDVTVDLRVGGSIAFPWPDGDEMQTLEFTILRLEAPTLLEHSHTSPGSWMRYELEPTPDGTRLLATYFVPDPDMAIERGDLVGAHYGLDRLEAALAGNPAPVDMAAFAALQAEYAARELAAPPA